MEEAAKTTETTGLQKFREIDAIIDQYKADYSSLSIKGVDDKAGYEAVHKARMTVKNKRVEVDKLRKQMGDDARAYLNKVNTEGNRVIKLLKEIEEPLEKMQRDIDAEKQRIKEEKERKEKERIQQRVNRLFRIGMAYNGSQYEIGAVSITDLETTSLNDEQFDAKCLLAEEEAEKIRAEEARLAEERRLEAERLEKQRQEQEAEARRLAQEKARQEAENKRLMDEADRIEREKREAEQRRIKEEQDRKDAEIRRQREEEEAKQRELQRQKELKEAEERAAKAERDRIAKEEEERKLRELAEKQEAERQAALAPDKEKILQLIQQLRNLQYPTVSDGKAIRVIESARTMVDDISKFLTKATDQL